MPIYFTHVHLGGSKKGSERFITHPPCGFEANLKGSVKVQRGSERFRETSVPVTYVSMAHSHLLPPRQQLPGSPKPHSFPPGPSRSSIRSPTNEPHQLARHVPYQSLFRLIGDREHVGS